MEDYIVDQPPAIEQNFNSLKLKALSFIQKHSGYEWTNLNPSDPGITILDQLCFALTELGYCNDFDIKDILTHPNGELIIKDQFYLPEKILTTSPVTIDDYRKYLIDGIAAIRNVTIKVVDGKYQAYLLIDATGTSEEDIQSVCKAAFFYLNNARNLGELFAQPLPFKPAKQLLGGRIDIERESSFKEIIVNAQNKIDQFIFPEVSQMGYQQLIEQGYSADGIFNGPALENGWITTASLGTKKDEVLAIDINSLLSAIPGVVTVSGLAFGKLLPPAKKAVAADNEIIVIDLASSLGNGLDVYCKGKKIAVDPTLSYTIEKSQSTGPDLAFGASVNVNTELPKGKYRAIEDYYSIQNTFPEIFAVGPNAIVAGASDLEMAQSRQLKGYLTLFDQVLANQFSQLDGIHRLFSFKNSVCGAPADERDYFKSNEDTDEISAYPSPYQVFSPTYFYQDVYEIPHIRHLLRNNEAFNFGYVSQLSILQEHESWKAFKNDPYNAYIQGLSRFMEDANESYDRRNRILDHLLARHGESPLLINYLIEGSAYCGEAAKDRLIFKSLYLQNLGLLSYNRQKAYNFIAAKRISEKITDLPENYAQRILGDYKHNGIIDSRKIDHEERLSAEDFINYSAMELKMCLLLGLKSKYLNFISAYCGSTDRAADAKLANWLITQRRGFMIVETAMLLNYYQFEILITKTGDGAGTWKVTDTLNYQKSIDLVQQLSDNRNAESIDLTDLAIAGTTHKLEVTDRNDEALKYAKQIPRTDFMYSVCTSSGQALPHFDEFPIFTSDVEFIFPAFVDTLDSAEFKERINSFLQQSMPVHLGFDFHFLGVVQMEAFIPVFADLHNQLIFNPKKEFAY